MFQQEGPYSCTSTTRTTTKTHNTSYLGDAEGGGDWALRWFGLPGAGFDTHPIPLFEAFVMT